VRTCSGAGRVGVAAVAVLTSKVGIHGAVEQSYRTQGGVVPRCKIVVTWWMGPHTTSEVVAAGRCPVRAASVWLGARAREGEGARTASGTGGQERSERLGAAGAAIGCGSGLVAALAGGKLLAGS